MALPVIPSEIEIAELVKFGGEVARGLAFERDQLRELVKAKDQYIACYKTRKSPTEALFSRLERLTALLNSGLK